MNEQGRNPDTTTRSEKIYGRKNVIVLNFIGGKFEIFILYLSSGVFVVNVCKLNKTNDVGALRLIVCSKYQEDKRQVLTLNHQVAPSSNMNWTM